MKTLREVKVGQTAVVSKLHGEGAVRRRIMDMGITKGVEIFVRKVAPPGGSHRGQPPGLRAEHPQGGRRDDRSTVKRGFQHPQMRLRRAAGSGTTGPTPNCGALPEANPGKAGSGRGETGRATACFFATDVSLY